jgi:hypothetical protein
MPGALPGEGARMSAGLAATQLALSREHRLAALGALATAAAHELGTPLGTIAVVSRELERALPPNSSESDDAKLLREQAERCRAILARLANPEEPLLGATARLPLGAFLENIVEPYRGDDLEITIALTPEREGDPVPHVWRAPELLHGLGNIIENAADFARSHVRIQARWNASLLHPGRRCGPGLHPRFSSASANPISPRPDTPARRNRAGPTLGARRLGLGLHRQDVDRAAAGRYVVNSFRRRTLTIMAAQRHRRRDLRRGKVEVVFVFLTSRFGQFEGIGNAFFKLPTLRHRARRRADDGRGRSSPRSWGFSAIGDLTVTVQAEAGHLRKLSKNSGAGGYPTFEQDAARCREEPGVSARS